MSEVNNTTDLNETVIEDEVRDAEVITVPIDETLTMGGEAADAAAVGAALALKADLSQIVTISVNGQPADNQGVILIDAGDVPMSDDPEADSVAEAIAAIDTTIGDVVTRDMTVADVTGE